MTITRNPFDAGGYSLAEMTQAINILPNLYTRLGQIGLFRFEGVTQRSIVIEQREGRAEPPALGAARRARHRRQPRGPLDAQLRPALDPA
jgi:hypothetical protein